MNNDFGDLYNKTCKNSERAHLRKHVTQMHWLTYYFHSVNNNKSCNRKKTLLAFKKNSRYNDVPKLRDTHFPKAGRSRLHIYTSPTLGFTRFSKEKKKKKRDCTLCTTSRALLSLNKFIQASSFLDVST